ncbi:LuxR C-terminal-related transcriptional regulator [Bifidobacterium sp. ESL0763]|uniref:helix-turn-helix transcriptional regulator n=1 Tax=Bifidobacterium sp. ESL0763 TaxID=2983227 RepID=UPI0023F93A39|nr:LuxR C-terminal-related transcriptional regulator [Bifidobacterium sp. ESL0763]MDF7664254.1 LuxR C-terminal-related transcriptional regulator [Bifidobacterium sp. ESL0763]
MTAKTTTTSATTRIGVVDADPCALSYIGNLVQHLQNLDGHRFDLWQTTKPKKVLHHCKFGLQPTDILVLDMRLAGLVEEIKLYAPGTAIIGTSTHVEDSLEFLRSPELVYTVVDKFDIRRELSKAIHSVYQDMALKAKRSPAPPPSEPGNQQTPSADPQTRHRPADGKEAVGSSATGKTTSEKKKNRTQTGGSVGLQSQKLKANRAYLSSVPLSPSEKRIMTLSLANYNPSEIASQLKIASSTIYSHRHTIKLKLRAHSWAEATHIYRQRLNGTG